MSIFDRVKGLSTHRETNFKAACGSRAWKGLGPGVQTGEPNAQEVIIDAAEELMKIPGKEIVSEENSCFSPAFLCPTI